MRGDNFGTVVTQEGVCYQGVEVQFHTPSEHTFGGRKSDMELQIIHKAITPGHLGKKLVLAVLFNFDPSYEKGKVPFLDDIDVWTVPNPDANNRQVQIKNVNLNRIFSHTTTGLLDVDFSRASYFGSLTSPPCDENTIMVVKTKALPIK